MTRFVAVLVAFAVAACGGSGKCELGPCEIPPHACDSDEDCFQTELCDFLRDSCGASEMDRGLCVRRPARDECAFDDVQLVCGCDGQSYENSCIAARAGTDVDVGGGCSFPVGTFSCGGVACLRDKQFCTELVFGENESRFDCEVLPPECRNDRTCDCVPSFGCEDCTDTNGEVRMKCEISPPQPDAATSSAAGLRASTSASR